MIEDLALPVAVLTAVGEVWVAADGVSPTRAADVIAWIDYLEWRAGRHQRLTRGEGPKGVCLETWRLEVTTFRPSRPAPRPQAVPPG